MIFFILCSLLFFSDNLFSASAAADLSSPLLTEQELAERLKIGLGFNDEALTEQKTVLEKLIKQEQAISEPRKKHKLLIQIAECLDEITLSHMKTINTQLEDHGYINHKAVADLLKDCDKRARLKRNCVFCYPETTESLDKALKIGSVDKSIIQSLINIVDDPLLPGCLNCNTRKKIRDKFNFLELLMLKLEIANKNYLVRKESEEANRDGFELIAKKPSQEDQQFDRHLLVLKCLALRYRVGLKRKYILQFDTTTDRHSIVYVLPDLS